MAATLATIGKGYVLAWSATLMGTYAPVIEILELKPGKKAVQKITVQRNDSPDLYGEKIPGWIEEGDWDAKCIYEPGKRTVLDGLVAAPSFFKFTRPNGTTTSAFAGFISELGDEVPIKEYMTTDFKITVDGKVTFTS